MITQIWIFLLSFNFLNIESTGKISPSYYVSRACTDSFVNTVNNLKTYNKKEITINNKEHIILTTAVQTYNDIKGREKVYEKFNTKIEDIKCTYSFIVKTRLVYLTHLLEELRTGRSVEDLREKLKVLKEEAGFMILTFQLGYFKVAKWFWSYFTKIMAIVEYKSNKRFFGENPFGEDELQSGITNFIKDCKDHGYLSKKKTDSDLMSKYPNVPRDINQYLRESEYNVYNNRGMKNLKISLLYLKPFWNENETLFGQITGSVVDWEPTKRRLAVEVNKTKEYVKNRYWISKPFGHLSYHELIKQIINARAYIFLWVMLVIFDKVMANIDEDDFKITYVHTINTINTVLEFLAYTNTFFYDIVTDYNWTLPDDRNLSNLIARISVKAKDSLVELNGRNLNGSDWISLILNDELGNDMMLKFLKEFADNYNQLKAKLNPFYYVLAMSLLSEGD